MVNMYCPEDNEMVDKILKQLTAIIKEDHELKEFMFIPTCISNIDRNVCPVKHERTNCLGLETWCIPLLFKHSQKQIIQTKRMKKKLTREQTEAVNVYLNGALLIQPDVTTFWNMKREIIKYLDVEEELRFNALVLSHKGKSYETYSFRRWLLGLKGFEALGGRDVVWERECQVLTLATVRTPNNYHAWNHRIWCLENVWKEHGDVVRRAELAFTEKWNLSHVSEHSGFHYRQHLLQSLSNYFMSLDEDLGSFDMIEHLAHELYTVLKQLHETFPGHETIWYHRRWVMAAMNRSLHYYYKTPMEKQRRIEIHKLPPTVNVTDVNVSPDAPEPHILHKHPNDFYDRLMVQERTILERLSEKNGPLTYEAELARMYKKWMVCTQNMDVSISFVSAI